MPSPSEHKLTLADLKAVEKAGGQATERPWVVDGSVAAIACQKNGRSVLFVSAADGRPDETREFTALAANHAVEMKQALAEALEVLESARRYRDRSMWRTEKASSWLELHMKLNKFHENWPGLVKK